jgi:arylsulfatase
MSESRKRPNIVLVLADNLGWGELGCYGGGALRGAPTPRIDALSKEGLKCLNFNVESDCVPTRSALMTGRHPILPLCSLNAFAFSNPGASRLFWQKRRG